MIDTVNEQSYESLKERLFFWERNSPQIKLHNEVPSMEDLKSHDILLCDTPTLLYKDKACLVESIMFNDISGIELSKIEVLYSIEKFVVDSGFVYKLRAIMK